MQKYKALQHFQWGNLKINKNQILLIENLDGGHSLVSIEHYPNKSQVVGTKAIKGMTLLERIEKY